MDTDTESLEVESSERPLQHRRPNRSVLAFAAAAACLSGYMGMPKLFPNESSQDRRNDPGRPKTAEDLRKMQKACEKRERKKQRNV